MNNIMKKTDYFDMLLKNFRLQEACGFLAALVNKGLIEEERGKNIESLIRTYNYIITNDKLDKEGIRILEFDEYDFDDINVEKRRLCRCLNENTDEKYRMLLILLNVYSAIANEDYQRVERQFSKLIEKLDSLVLIDRNTINCLGTYDCFNFLSNIVLKYCDLNIPILEYLDQFAIKVQLNRVIGMVH